MHKDTGAVSIRMKVRGKIMFWLEAIRVVDIHREKSPGKSLEMTHQWYSRKEISKSVFETDN
jgi:hypothetical protein